MQKEKSNFIGSFRVLMRFDSFFCNWLLEIVQKGIQVIVTSISTGRLAGTADGAASADVYQKHRYFVFYLANVVKNRAKVYYNIDKMFNQHKYPTDLPPEPTAQRPPHAVRLSSCRIASAASASGPSGTLAT